MESQNIIEVPFRVPVECAAFTLCTGEFHDFDPFSSGEGFSEQVSPYHINVGSYKYHLRVSVECVAFTLCYGEFHDFDPVSSGEGFSEQASPYQTSEVLLEPQNIIEVPFKGPS